MAVVLESDYDDGSDEGDEGIGSDSNGSSNSRYKDKDSSTKSNSIISCNHPRERVISSDLPSSMP